MCVSRETWQTHTMHFVLFDRTIRGLPTPRRARIITNAQNALFVITTIAIYRTANQFCAVILIGLMYKREIVNKRKKNHIKNKEISILKSFEESHLILKQEKGDKYGATSSKKVF